MTFEERRYCIHYAFNCDVALVEAGTPLDHLDTASAFDYTRADFSYVNHFFEEIRTPYKLPDKHMTASGSALQQTFDLIFKLEKTVKRAMSRAARSEIGPQSYPPITGLMEFKHFHWTIGLSFTSQTSWGGLANLCNVCGFRVETIGRTFSA